MYRGKSKVNYFSLWSRQFRDLDQSKNCFALIVCAPVSWTKSKENKRDGFEAKSINVKIEKNDFLNSVKVVTLCYINHEKVTAEIRKVEKSMSPAS